MELLISPVLSYLWQVQYVKQQLLLLMALKSQEQGGEEKETLGF